MNANPWHPESSPDGYVSLGVAENALMHDTLRDFINSQALVDSKSKALTYGDGPQGSTPLRTALASFITEHLRSATQLNADQVIVTNGVSTAIEHTAWALANPGEGILLGRPYYRAFLPDISLRAGVKVVPVSFGSTDPLSLECVKKYEEALLTSQENGVTVRALLLCHPHNPLGRCYSRETIFELMKLCQQYKIHLISDEIYALSVWKNTVDQFDAEPVEFQSVLSLNTGEYIDPQLVHVLWGASKDFGANGLRLGVIISQSNPEFLLACRACSFYSSPSSLTENAILAILSDKTFVESYLRTSEERLSEAYCHAVTLLKKYSIPYTPGANAAFFLWLDLGKKYAEGHSEVSDTAAITQVIFERLMERKIFVVPGEAAGAEEPGWFRLVFTQPKDVMEEGIKRISEAIS
jgi:aspartate/methionine/tyrosine aminotransferase